MTLALTSTDPLIPPTPVNSDDVDRVKGKWGEDLNTAFQYEKYADGGGTWASAAVRYEWSEESPGDAIAPRDEVLEKQLFGDDGEGNMGINFDKFVLYWERALMMLGMIGLTSPTGRLRKSFLL